MKVGWCGPIVGRTYARAIWSAPMIRRHPLALLPLLCLSLPALGVAAIASASFDAPGPIDMMTTGWDPGDGSSSWGDTETSTDTGGQPGTTGWDTDDSGASDTGGLDAGDDGSTSY